MTVKSSMDRRTGGRTDGRTTLAAGSSCSQSCFCPYWLEAIAASSPLHLWLYITSCTTYSHVATNHGPTYVHWYSYIVNHAALYYLVVLYNLYALLVGKIYQLTSQLCCKLWRKKKEIFDSLSLTFPPLFSFLGNDDQTFFFRTWNSREIVRRRATEREREHPLVSQSVSRSSS